MNDWRSIPMLWALRRTWAGGSSRVIMRPRSPRRAPSAMNWRAMTLFPAPEIPTTSVVLAT